MKEKKTYQQLKMQMRLEPCHHLPLLALIVIIGGCGGCVHGVPIVLKNKH